MSKKSDSADAPHPSAARLMNVTKDADRIKPIETLLGNSLSSFSHYPRDRRSISITPISLSASTTPSSPMHYAKNAGGLLLVRPRVLGNKGFGFFETRDKDPRKFPFELEGPARDVTPLRSRSPPATKSTTCRRPSTPTTASPATIPKPKSLAA